MIPKSQNLYPLAAKVAAPSLIFENHICSIVLPAIKLHRQMSLMGVKVKNVLSHRMLPAELEPEPAVSQKEPEQALGIGLLQS